MTNKINSSDFNANRSKAKIERIKWIFSITEHFNASSAIQEYTSNKKTLEQHDFIRNLVGNKSSKGQKCGLLRGNETMKKNEECMVQFIKWPVKI